MSRQRQPAQPRPRPPPPLRGPRAPRPVARPAPGPSPVTYLYLALPPLAVTTRWVTSRPKGRSIRSVRHLPPSFRQHYARRRPGSRRGPVRATAACAVRPTAIGVSRFLSYGPPRGLSVEGAASSAAGTRLGDRAGSRGTGLRFARV